MSEFEEISGLGREGWESFYKKKFSQPISNYSQFSRAIEQYGEWNIYEAMVVASLKSLEGDPLPYVLTVAHSKWKEEEKNSQSSADYDRRMQMARERTKDYGEALKNKIEKARRLNADRSTV